MNLTDKEYVQDCRNIMESISPVGVLHEILSQAIDRIERVQQQLETKTDALQDVVDQHTYGDVHSLRTPIDTVR